MNIVYFFLRNEYFLKLESYRIQNIYDQNLFNCTDPASLDITPCSTLQHLSYDLSTIVDSKKKTLTHFCQPCNTTDRLIPWFTHLNHLILQHLSYDLSTV
jgi:hypothetical protein